MGNTLSVLKNENMLYLLLIVCCSEFIRYAKTQCVLQTKREEGRLYCNALNQLKLE